MIDYLKYWLDRLDDRDGNPWNKLIALLGGILGGVFWFMNDGNFVECVLSGSFLSVFVKMTIDGFRQRKGLQEEVWSLYLSIKETISDAEEVKLLFLDLMVEVVIWDRAKWWKNKRFRRKLEKFRDQYSDCAKSMNRIKGRPKKNNPVTGGKNKTTQPLHIVKGTGLPAPANALKIAGKRASCGPKIPPPEVGYFKGRDNDCL